MIREAFGQIYCKFVQQMQIEHFQETLQPCRLKIDLSVSVREMVRIRANFQGQDPNKRVCECGETIVLYWNERNFIFLVLKKKQKFSRAHPK